MSNNKHFHKTSWHQHLSRFSYLLLPGHCKLCKSDSLRKLDLCALCESDLPEIGPHCSICSEPFSNQPAEGCSFSALKCGHCLGGKTLFSRAHIPYIYKAPIDRLLIAFKFKGDMVAGKVLGELLSQHLEKSIKHGHDSPDRIIAVPLHWRRRLGRGFNQAHVLATTLSRRLSIPIENKLVSRKTHTRAQHHLDRKQRLLNLHDAFSVNRSAGTGQIEGKSFAIVDDVFTTGSTANAITKLLIDNGADRVVVWAVARATLDN